MRKYLLVLSFLIGCLFLSCSKDSSPTSVRQQSSLTLSDTVALMNYSFEKNGVASIDGWQLSDTLTKKYLSFSTDIPSDGGSYSLVIQSDSGIFVDLRYKIIPPSSTCIKCFKYSYESKIINPDSALIFVRLGLYGTNGYIDYTAIGIIRGDQWRAVNNISDTTSTKIDSLIIEISAFSNNIKTKNYFDNIRLVEEDYH